MRTCTIGIMCDAVNEWYQNTIFLGATEALRELGATVVMYNGGILRSRDPSESDRNTLFDLVDAELLDGLLVVAPVGDHVGNQALSAFCWRYARMPVCTVAVELPGRPCVLVDNLGGMGRLVEHMVLDHGKRRIAFVRGPIASAEAAGRYTTYRQVLERHGIPVDPALVTIGDFRAPSGAESVRLLCDERRVAFDALVAANDNMALGAMEALQARGIEVPGQVSVAGFDDMEEGRFATPPLTTVRQPIRESARQAARLLMSLVREGKGPPKITLETQVVLRESCGCNVDEAVASRGQVVFVEVESLAAYLTQRRDAIAAALSRALSSEQARVPNDWPGPLVDTFIADLQQTDGQRFVAFLLATLRRVIGAGGSVRPWQVVVSALRSAVMIAQGDADGLRRARDLLHGARVLVGDLHERGQALHRIGREDWIRRLHETSEVLTKAFGEKALVDAVAGQLPRWKIPAAAISLYDGGERRQRLRARPLFLYDDDRRLDCDREASFASFELAPAGWLAARPRTLVVEPLVFRGEQFGFSLFEVGPIEGEVYEWLRRLLSSAMKGARLVEQVVDAATSRQRAERERLEKEMEIAARIQTSLVSKTVAVKGLEIAATMLPASEVGGDYYDVIPVDDGCWIGIGDVAGHGLQTGLVMLIIQGVLGALVRQKPDSAPREPVRIVNAVMYDSVRRRMGQDEHATLLLLRYAGGRVAYAGAHEEIIVHRAALGRCERIETLGPVFGAIEDLGDTLGEAAFDLAEGDLLVLYTDGLVEAMNLAGETFGVERLCEVVERSAAEPVEVIRDRILRVARAWMGSQRDDISLVVARRTPA